MKHRLLVAFFFSAQTILAQAGPDRHAAQLTTEVYATASDGTRLEWAVYAPQSPGPWPAVLVIHGGRFVGGDLSEPGVISCAQDIAAAGYLALAINYRLAPPGSLPGQRSRGRYPDQYDDVQLAVVAARADPRGNGQVGAVGGSAGATHMAWVAATGHRGAERIDVGVGLSGAYDFSDLRPDTYLSIFIETVTNYVGVPASDLPALRAASPAWNLDRTVSPLFLFDTEGDLMPSVQLDDMAAKLRQNGATNFQAATLPGDSHSFEYWSQAKEDALNFLARYLRRR